MGPTPRILSLVLLVGCLDMAVAMAGEPACDGPYKGRRLTAEEFATVFGNHQAWQESGRRPDDERRANLCQACLSWYNLQGAFLDRTDLQGATLRGANLQGAVLVEANLQEARLFAANLQGVLYEPNPAKLPSFWTLTGSHNHLGTLVLHDSPAALITLREAFKKELVASFRHRRTPAH